MYKYVINWCLERWWGGGIRSRNIEHCFSGGSSHPPLHVLTLFLTHKAQEKVCFTKGLVVIS